MLEFYKYKKIFIENVYSINPIDNNDIINNYESYKLHIKKTEDLVFTTLTKQGIKIPNNPIEDIKNSEVSGKYENILIKSALSNLEDVYGKKRLDDSGMCLISNLIGKACQMIHNVDLLGVVRGYDEKHPRLLFIDFGDPEEVKVDIDELIIQGQKKS